MKNTTKVLALLLSLIMMLSVATIGSFATDAATTSPWDGVAVSTSFIGSGTEADPYLIQSAADLKYLADKVNDGTLDTDGKYFKQTVDIDLADKPWTPIGNDQKSIGEGEAATNPGFSGIYDGNYMTIKGLNVTDESASFTVEVPATDTAPASTETRYGGAALFGYTKVPTENGVNTEIKNLAVFGKVNTTKPVSNAGLIAVSDCAHITNCYVDVDVTVDGDADGDITVEGNGKYVAGIAANTTMELIIDSTVNAGDIVVTGITVGVYAGNFTGYSRGGVNSYTSRTMKNCYGLGDVTVTATGTNSGSTSNDTTIRAGGMTAGIYNGIYIVNSHFYGTFNLNYSADLSTYPMKNNALDAAKLPRVGYFAGGLGYWPANTILGANVVLGCTCLIPENVTVSKSINAAITGEGVMALVGGGTSITFNETGSIDIITEAPAVPYKVANMFLVEVVVEEETTEEPTTEEETTVEPEDDDDETTGKTETNAPETDDKSGDDKKDSGCASVVGGLSVIAIVAGAALVLVKKKD